MKTDSQPRAFAACVGDELLGQMPDANSYLWMSENGRGCDEQDCGLRHDLLRADALGRIPWINISRGRQVFAHQSCDVEGMAKTPNQITPVPLAAFVLHVNWSHNVPAISSRSAI